MPMWEVGELINLLEHNRISLVMLQDNTPALRPPRDLPRAQQLIDMLMPHIRYRRWELIDHYYPEWTPRLSRMAVAALKAERDKLSPNYAPECEQHERNKAIAAYMNEHPGAKFLYLMPTGHIEELGSGNRPKGSVRTTPPEATHLTHYGAHRWLKLPPAIQIPIPLSKVKDAKKKPVAPESPSLFALPD